MSASKMSLIARHYVPFDAVDEMPRARILRALRWQGWLAVDELSAVLTVPSSQRDRYAKELSRLTAAGAVAVRRTVGACMRNTTREYAITATGIAQLSALHARALIPSPDELLCVTCTVRTAARQQLECERCVRALRRLSADERAQHARAIAALRADRSAA